MEAVTITLNGVEVSGDSGMTILDLARESGVDIPTLCHDPNLAAAGACRICLVEEERSGALLASCVIPIRAGMAVNTRSPRVLERRKTLLKLMLASHPDTCMVCDKGNQCQLRRIAAEMGIGWIELQRIPQSDVIEDVNPFIERDLSKCIMCARCIRADQELVVNGAIDYLARGFAARPATLNDLPLEESECSFCGTCVATCPTGALREKGLSYRGATATSVDTVCPFCGCGCGISLEVKDGRVVRVRPSAVSPVNHGASCVRGSYGYDFIHSPDRLLTPLLTANGNLQPASWEHALDHAAAELNRIRDRYGPDSLAILGSSKCTNEENYLFQRLARVSLGTNNIDNGSRLYWPASREGLGWSIGFPGATGSLDELELSNVIMVIGADPAVSAPAVGYALKRAARMGARLLLVDPRRTGLSRFARLWLKPAVGTDLALINGLAEAIIKGKVFDQEFVSRRTDGFATFEKSLEKYTPERVQELTTVPAGDLTKAARLLAGVERVSIIFGNGITQQTGGASVVMALANLAMLSGSISGHRGGIFGLQRENNAQGACDMGSLPDFLPGYQSVSNDRARAKFEKRWGVALAPKAGLNAMQMIDQAKAGMLKGMLIFGEDPVAGFPAPSRVHGALASLEFLLVADLFLTKTAKLATVVLPAASFAEKEGTFTNFEGRVQTVRQAISPAGESLPDWEIAVRLAARLGEPGRYDSVQQVKDEIEQLVPFYRSPARGDSYKEDLDWVEPENEPSGTRRLYGGPFPSGFGRFSTNEYMAAEAGDPGYPLTVISGSVLHHFGSGTRTSRASRLKQFAPRGWIEVNRTDADRLGVKDGDSVKIISSAGGVTTTARVSDMLPAGLLFMPLSFPDSPVNELFGMESGSGKASSLKTCAVRLERMAG